MLYIRIGLVFLQIFSASGRFPIPSLLQNEASDDSSGVNQGQEHKIELEHVKITREMEDMILDEIDERLADLEDIDVDAKILVRHLDNHPNFQGYESYVNNLHSIEENVLEAYKEELNLMKRRIIASNHDLKVYEMKDMNLILDNAEVSVNKTRGMIDSFIDVHVESEEHHHEHDHEDPDDQGHGDDGHDTLEDYSDLLSNVTEATDEEESLIVDTIAKGLEDLDEVINHRSQLEEHLQDHRESQDHVNTNSADLVLGEIQVNDVEDYKVRLQELRKQVGDSKGHVKIDFVDKIISTLERANIYVEVSKNRLRIADQLDDEASNDHRDDGHEDEFSSDEEDDIDIREQEEKEVLRLRESLESSYSDDVIESGTNGVTEIEVEQEALIGTDPEGGENKVSNDSNIGNDDVEDTNYFYFVLGCIVCILLLVAVAAMIFRSNHQSGSGSLSKSDKFHEIGGICSPQDDRSLHNYNFKTFDSPKVGC